MDGMDEWYGKDSLHNKKTFERWLLLETIGALGLWLYFCSTFGEGGGCWRIDVDGEPGVFVGRFLSKVVLEKLMKSLVTRTWLEKSMKILTKCFFYMYQSSFSMGKSSIERWHEFILCTSQAYINLKWDMVSPLKIWNNGCFGKLPKDRRWTFLAVSFMLSLPRCCCCLFVSLRKAPSW